jgi:excisionase family DNA binding protein
MPSSLGLSTRSAEVEGARVVRKDTTKTHYAESVKVMTVREVCAYLHLNPATIYRLLRRHQIPAFRVGSEWRFNIEQIDRWRLEQGKLGN